MAENQAWTTDRPRMTITRVADLALLPPAPDLKPAPSTLAESLIETHAINERFELWPAPKPGVPMVAANALSDDDIVALVQARGRGLGTNDPKVAASLFLQGYVFRVAAPVIGSWVLHKRLPEMSADNVLLRFNEIGRPIDVALRAPVVHVLPGDAISDADTRTTTDLASTAIDMLLERHLMAMHDRIRSLFKLGMLISKGAVSSQIGMAFTYIDTYTSIPWPAVAGPAMMFLTRSHDRIAGEGRAGDMILKQLDDSEGVTFRRGTCCLVYKIDDKELCGGCPLRSDDDRHEVYTQRLLSRPPECRCATNSAGSR